MVSFSGSREIRLQLIDVVEAFASGWNLHCEKDMQVISA